MECTDESCKMETHATCACGSDKPYDECCGCQTIDPVEHGMMALHKAFFAALHQAQTERLKKKIESGFGPVLDKEADAVFEAISKVWTSMVTQADAKKELAAKLQKIYSDANRK